MVAPTDFNCFCRGGVSPPIFTYDMRLFREHQGTPLPVDFECSKIRSFLWTAREVCPYKGRFNSALCILSFFTLGIGKSNFFYYQNCPFAAREGEVLGDCFACQGVLVVA